MTVRITTAAVALLALLAGVASARLAPGAQAPVFTLDDTDGQAHSLASYLEQGQIVVLEWFNPDCPFVKKHHQSHQTMADLQQKYADQGVTWLAINSGAEGKQGAGVERNQRARKEYGLAYPILMDATGAVGKMYGATNTPHMFIITPDGVVAYAGAIDNDPSVAAVGDENHVAAALGDLLAGRAVKTAATKAYGCSVKY